MESSSPSLRSLWRLRLGLGAVVLLGAAICFLGTSWDIQWHSLIGRDRTLIPPHEMMLTGVGLSGVAALSSVLLETIWARRNRLLAERTVRFAGLFNGSLGAYMAGFAALDAAVAFPLDAYWHSLYGIDVSIWAPFHVMIITGMGLAGLGGAYMLASAGRLADEHRDVWIRRLGYAGALAGFGTTFNIFVFLLFNAFERQGIITLGGVSIIVFPLLAALLSAAILTAAVRAVPWRWAAAGVALAGLVLVVAVGLYVPPATNLLVQIEHQSFRRHNPGIALVAFEWPLMSVLAAVTFDVVRRAIRRVGSSQQALLVAVALCSVLACLPVMPIEPALGVAIFMALGGPGTAISLLLGLAGAFWGAWLGGRAAQALRNMEAAA